MLGGADRRTDQAEAARSGSLVGRGIEPVAAARPGKRSASADTPAQLVAARDVRVRVGDEQAVVAAGKTAKP